MRKKIVIAYIPVLHQGYINFLRRHRRKSLYVLGDDFISKFNRWTKEIRAVPAELMVKAVHSLGICDNVFLLNEKTIIALLHIASVKGLKITTPDEEISIDAATRLFSSHPLKTDPIFLRWDRKNVYSQKPVGYDRISKDRFDRNIMKQLEEEAQKSSDWWRQVGAAIVNKERSEIISTHNEHVPSPHTPYALGDPRDVVEAGKDSHLSSAIHAEQKAILDAAKIGILSDSSIYVTVFPCPVCAKLIAYSGIKKLFFSSGHASLDGLDILKAKGIEIVLVK